MASQSEEDYICPVCCDIFKTPVFLSCSHSVCKECLHQFWRTKGTQECPVCRRRSSRDNPPVNLVLKNLCESFLKERNEVRSSGSEEICSLHSEKLKLFCLEDKQPVCLVCINSKKHDNHKFRPIDEVVSSYKEELNTALKTLQRKLKHNETMKGEFEETVENIKSQAEHTEHQIKQQFETLHPFLRDEEEATITALREEEEQKKQMMKKRLEEINTHISALSLSIRDMEEMMNASDVCFLKKFPVSMERVQISSQPDPQTPSGALIHVPRYLGNLLFRVWKKMQDIVQNKSERRLVLLGRSGVGKSAAGNTILGQKEFRSEISVTAVTCECSAAHTTVSDRSVTVVDIPGFTDTQMKHEGLMTEIMKSVDLSSPGPHAFLIVFPVNLRFTEHDQRILEQTEMMFGQEVLKYSIILFTYGDQLKGKSIKDLIKRNSRMRHLVQESGDRYHVFNNEDQNNREQVTDLLQKIDTMIEKNGGYYSHQMLEEAQRRREDTRRGRGEKTAPKSKSGKCV
ncbi:E3 ubiquitin-protein ligase TRIM35 isoform X1 [Carassius gibelio]|uniref:E3 ubiquitin-protein ligase TRIM35 isoform X1 n=1 Tax=Carassius gibelio TaxID=101364 RepID=UPI002277770E|nr:E3 ubiquitin-protein ligase TRIM35 isoform X1 [Carassius gibelio]